MRACPFTTAAGRGMIGPCSIGPSRPLVVRLRLPSERGGLSRCSGGFCAKEAEMTAVMDAPVMLPTEGF